MKKRFFVSVFIGVIFTVIAIEFLPYGAILGGVLAVLCVVGALIKKDYLPIIATCILCLVTCICASKNYVYIGYKAIPFGEGWGNVEKSNETYIYLKDVKVLDGKKVKKAGKVRLVYDGSDFECGDTVKFTGEFIPFSLNGTVQETLTYVADGYSYKVKAVGVEKTGHKTGIDEFFSKIRNGIYYKVASVMEDKDTAAVMYAMFTGDRQYVPSYVYSLFASGGVAHLLAVSGLHLSVLLSFVTLLLDKMHIRPLIKCLLSGMFLVFYTLLTGFSPSVVRAAIMSYTAMCASSSGMRYDPLNALCFAGSAILAVNPYRLFDLSFQLSFASCFGIIAFYKPEKTLKRNLLSSPLKLTGSATLGTLPIVLYRVGTVSSVTLAGNFVLVPLATLSLNLLFVCLILSFILPFLKFILYLPYCTGYVTLQTVRFFGGFRMFSFCGINGLAVIGLFALLAFFSRFCTVNRKIKGKVAVLCVLAWGISVIVSGVIYRSSSKVTVVSQSDGHLFAYVEQSGNYAVGFESTADEKQFVQYNIGYLDGAVVLNEKDVKGITGLRNMSIPVDTVYCNGKYSVPEIEGQKNVNADTVKMGDGKLTFVDGGAVYRFRGCSVFFSDGSVQPLPECDIAVFENGTVYDIKNGIKFASDGGENITVKIQNGYVIKGGEVSEIQ